MVILRRLLVTLLFVPFLAGVNVPAVALDIAGEPAATDVLSRTTARLADPALPGVAAIGCMLEVGSMSSWRTSRSHGSPADPVCDSDVQTARTRASRLIHAYLEYCQALDQARTNVPITYGNPPPVSLT